MSTFAITLKKLLQEKNMKQITWKELHGNPFVYGLHPDMLTDDGYKICKSVQVKGVSLGQKEVCEIRFDRDYCISFVIQNLIIKAKFQNYKQLERFVSECWNAWKSSAARPIE